MPPAITVEDPRLSPIVEACGESGWLALVGAPVQGEPGRAHSATLAIEGTGATVAYRRVWLGTTESERFTPGDEPAALDVDGWRLGPCHPQGHRRPATRASTAALGIDAYVAGTVKSADEAAIQAERARRVAADHRIWVAVASFAGPTGGYAPAPGRSSISSPTAGSRPTQGPRPAPPPAATLS